MSRCECDLNPNGCKYSCCVRTSASGGVILRIMTGVPGESASFAEIYLGPEDANHLRDEISRTLIQSEAQIMRFLRKLDVDESINRERMGEFDSEIDPLG
jgi:hypothetical protein